MKDVTWWSNLLFGTTEIPAPCISFEQDVEGMQILPCHLGTFIAFCVYFSKIGVMLASCGLVV